MSKDKYWARELSDDELQLYSFISLDKAYIDLYNAEYNDDRDLADEIYTMLLKIDPLGIFLYRTKHNGSAYTWKLKRRILRTYPNSNYDIVEIISNKLYKGDRDWNFEKLSFEEVKTVINHVKGREGVVDKFNSKEFEIEMKGLYMQEDRKLEIERLKQEGIDWLVDKGVELKVINEMISKKRLEIATIEDAKREYLRLIELCDKWDGVDLEVMIIAIKENHKEVNDHNRLDRRMRKLIIDNIDKYTDEELKELVNKHFDKIFNFSYTRAYVKKNGTKVGAYVRILFKDKL